MAENAPAAAEVAAAERGAHTVEDVPFALRLSERLRKFVDLVGRWGSWLVVPMVLITVLDVVGRKISWLDDEGRLHGLQIFLVRNIGRIFESTMLQELEWHFHAGLFALVLGYGYIHNSHVRVDLIRENLAFRKQALLEFLGITLFLLPYTACIVYFSWGYAVTSYEMGEISASTVGLTHRWIIKSVLVFGLIVAGIAGIAVWLQAALVLWGDPDQRFPLMTLEWPEERGTKIEGKERISLDGAVDSTLPPDERAKALSSKILTGSE
ncbi:MAG TPA: TRAP transporter small permease subunit [Burkholderiales bacterium]|nr:TRAP transporter small permease subunit [Burkholderiales bacterium]